MTIGMTAVWQTLLPGSGPETPITPISDQVAPFTTTESTNTNNQSNSNDHLRVPTSNNLNLGSPVSSNCSNSNHQNSSQAQLLHPNSELKNRLYSRDCEPLWKLYSKRAECRKKHHENRRRIFLKNGEVNSKRRNIMEKKERYWSDMFTSLVDARWRWTLVIFSLSYLFSWIGFGVVWWIIISSHGDVEHFGLEDGWEPCVMGVRSLTSIFLFSVETQHTIGYGFHRMTDNCPEAIVTLCIQSITGVLIEAFMVGVVFAKLSRPKKRSQTLIFSKNAVISQRDGQLFLMFRVGDMRKSKILEAHVRAQIITKRSTAEGEIIPIHQEEIKVGGFGEDEDRILLLWPTLIFHEINEESPLYSMSASEFLQTKLEIIVIFEGVVESTGMTTQARTSYLPSEILWGHRFSTMTSYKSDQGVHEIDFEYFNSTFPVETPLCSSQDLDHIRQLKSEGLSGREIMNAISSNNEAGTSSSGNGSSPPPRSCLIENHIVGESIVAVNKCWNNDHNEMNHCNKNKNKHKNKNKNNNNNRISRNSSSSSDADDNDNFTSSKNDIDIHIVEEKPEIVIVPEPSSTFIPNNIDFSGSTKVKKKNMISNCSTKLPIGHCNSNINTLEIELDCTTDSSDSDADQAHHKQLKQLMKNQMENSNSNHASDSDSDDDVDVDDEKIDDDHIMNKSNSRNHKERKRKKSFSTFCLTNESESNV